MENINENQPIPPIQPVPPKKWYADKIVMTMLVLVILAGLSLAIYFILNQPQDLGPVIVNHHQSLVKPVSPTSTPTNSTFAVSTTTPIVQQPNNPPVNISGWQTYKDSQLGFQVRYPSNWTYDKSTDTSTGNAVISVHFYPPGQTPGYEYQGDIIIDTVSNPKKMDLTAFYNQPDNNLVGYGQAIPMTNNNGYPEIKFSNIPAMIPSDQVSVNLGQTIVELTDVGQQHPDDGITNAMANSINIFSNSQSNYIYDLVFPNSNSYDGQITQTDTNTGVKSILISSIKNAFPELKAQNNETLSKLSFPANGDKLFFEEILSDTDAGPFALVAYDLKQKKFVKLKVSQYWQYDYNPEVSPDGLKLLASYGISKDGGLRKLYVLNLETDTATLLTTLAQNETLDSCGDNSCMGISDDLSWLNNNTAQYAVYDFTKQIDDGGGGLAHPLIEKRKVTQ